MVPRSTILPFRILPTAIYNTLPCHYPSVSYPTPYPFLPLTYLPRGPRFAFGATKQSLPGR